ncbi:uncharacterized protein FA14DRAFT_117799 [Meira miltonrushii]|uniref:RRM domain-containing protein n=1 Tax=Meira miltonrushii TaxID=1280837 RepID=A0A316VL63_9BASI|nr:uncharacterized protein FA14DRAFT_117799 [Meira miltonrushii]PWN38004.1 hypothetical protein FA14DRAFT_117799 [Meira miltonrushii]
MHSPFPESNAGPSTAPIQTTAFVGTISSGITDEWITRLLSACGHLRSFKRVNASFGFAEFADAESVLRAIAVLSGKQLPVMGNKEEQPKKLTMKANAETKTYLDQYEQGGMKSKEYDRYESQASAAVENIIAQMADPSNAAAAAESMPSYNVPSHLKDLPPEDLPEEHRGSVLSEIDKFRQSSAARDEERKRRERIQEIERTRTYSTGGRYNGHDQPANDRQSHQQPVGFVASSQAQEEKNMLPDERDAREEERRQLREKDANMRESQEAERRFLAVERNRLAHWERELAKQGEIEEKREQRARAMRKLAETWDQSREMERDMFYVDRNRWRSLRKQMREREEEEDEADKRLQVEEEERARVETERFLAQQAEDMAAYEKEQRAAGVLMPTEGVHVPLKLKRTNPLDEQASHSTVQAGVLGTTEDDSDVAAIKRGRLAHIDLSDEETKRAKTLAGLPDDREKLFAMQPVWERVSEDKIEDGYRTLLDSGIVESLGESVPDMVQELIDSIKKHATANELVGIVEPVLEEEAGLLIEKLWRELLVDTM